MDAEGISRRRAASLIPIAALLLSTAVVFAMTGLSPATGVGAAEQVPIAANSSGQYAASLAKDKVLAHLNGDVKTHAAATAPDPEMGSDEASGEKLPDAPKSDDDPTTNPPADNGSESHSSEAGNPGTDPPETPPPDTTPEPTNTPEPPDVNDPNTPDAPAQPTPQDKDPPQPEPQPPTDNEPETGNPGTDPPETPPPDTTPEPTNTPDVFCQLEVSHMCTRIEPCERLILSRLCTRPTLGHVFRY